VNRTLTVWHTRPVLDASARIPIRATTTRGTAHGTQFSRFVSVAVKRIILHTEASRGFGGQEIRILTEVRWLCDHGWPALIAAQPESRLLAEAQAAGLPVVAVPMRHALELRAFVALRRLTKNRDIGLIHTHSSVDSWLAALTGKSLRLPIVRSRHVSIRVHRRGALVYALADRIITSGATIKAVVAAAGVNPDKIVSIPTGVDLGRFHPRVSGNRIRAELGLDGPAVGIVANVRGSKGHRYFLEAAREVLRKRCDSRFVIAGDGVGFDDVRRQVAEMGLEREVLMTGFRRDVPELMAALDVLVVASTKSEGIPQVILQALAVATPVAASAVGGIPEIIRDGENGRLVPPADSHALAETILWLLNDPIRAREMARVGQAQVRGGHTVDIMMGRTTAVYRELLNI
jgi:glycosyltransferase involved in cell wall biosynthesis